MDDKPLKILAVDDTEMNISLLERFFRKLGHEMVVATNGQEAVERFEAERPDLILMDVMMPVMDGYDATREIRKRSGDQWVPIIFMSAKSATEDQVMGLEAGGDDYLTKPFAIAELLARTRSLLRRQSKSIQVLRAGDLEMDRAARRVTREGEELRFTPKEFGLLEYLLTRRDQAVSRQDLAEHVWDHTFDPASNTLDVIVYRIRKKIDGDRVEKLLHTVSGVGYLLASKRRSGTVTS